METPSPEHRKDIDGLRAIAVLSVISFHVAPDFMRGGFVGVDIFFVISGFLISEIIFRSLSSGRFSFLDFYSRRIRRIFPALIIVLGSTWAVGSVLLLPWEYTSLGRSITHGMLFVLNFTQYTSGREYFDGLADPGPLIHLWSLGVEEQFYLLWPLLLLLIWKSGISPAIAIILLTIASFIFNIASINNDPLAAFYLPWNRLWELSMGGALAYYQNYYMRGRLFFATHRSNPLSPNLRGILGSALLIASFYFIDPESKFPGWWALLPCTATLLLISAGPKSRFNDGVLSRSPIVFIGLISYPLYLWHWPIFWFLHLTKSNSHLATTAAISLTFLLAFLTYKYVEYPLRSSKRVKHVAVALGMALATCGCIGHMTYNQSIRTHEQSPAVQTLLRQLDGSQQYTESLRRMERMNQLNILGNGSRDVLYIGDSNMRQYYSRIEKILSDHPMNSRRAVFATYSGCGPVEGMEKLSIEPDLKACRAIMQHAREYARRPEVDTIVISASWYLHFIEAPRFGEPGSLSADTEILLARLQHLVTDLTANGKNVYIVLSIPVGKDFSFPSIVSRSVLPPWLHIDHQAPSRAKVTDAVEPITSRLRQLAQESHANIIDPMDHLCSSETCPVLSAQGDLMYRNRQHLLDQYVRDHITYLDATLLDTLRGQPASP